MGKAHWSCEADDKYIHAISRARTSTDYEKAMRELRQRSEGE
jgi:hypothetical protein